MPIDRETIDTYNTYTEEFAEKFERDGVPRPLIDAVFSRVSRENPIVFDIGCGSGKYASQILERTSAYSGIDASEEMIVRARESYPQASFFVGDMVTYVYPPSIDAVFAITSVVHLSPKDVNTLFKKLATALVPGGVILLTCKEGAGGERIPYGKEGYKRQFYYYTEERLRALLPNALKIEEVKTDTMGDRSFLTVVIRKYV